MSGITIGSGSIVAAKSVVVKDVEPYTIVGGNPAKPIKQRFPQHMIQQLLDIKWWDRSDEEINGIVPLL
jgi:chloramphenicol O-acetyltransferase type B